MSLRIESIDHVQITVPRVVEREALAFYDAVLGLERIAKPEPLRKNGGAWYRCGSIEVHVSPEEGPAGSSDSKRHVCFLVANLEAAKSALAEHGVEVIPDLQPIAGWKRIYVRDPGGNRIEIAQRLE